jgi:hypothetical protein
MDENLVGYLLGTLDPEAHGQVAAYLAEHPEARARLEALEQALAPLEADRADPDPPPGLAARALARVAEHHLLRLPDAPAPARSQFGGPPRRRLRPADALVAACLVVVVGGLASSLVARWWNRQQRTECANNLRQFWVALRAYGDQREGEFPRAEPEGARGVAGIFVPALQDAGVLGEVSVGCPAQGRRPPPRYSVGELEELYATSPEQFRAAARTLAGNYAYTLGYQEGGHLCGLRGDSGDSLPILADRSSPAGGNSPNHGGDGQNVLYVGGWVRWCARPTAGVGGDDIYLNRHNQVLAGVNRIDTVLGPSDARPQE